MIESAWRNGHNSNGMLETGGIRGTRKYIGTAEAQALLASLNIPCYARVFSDGQGQGAFASMIQVMEQHFSKPNAPPVYMQHRGHSLTVVGWEHAAVAGRERIRDLLIGTSSKPPTGPGNLFVFDPGLRLPKRLRNAAKNGGNVKALFEAYRYGPKYFKRFPMFEALFLGKE